MYHNITLEDIEKQIGDFLYGEDKKNPKVKHMIPYCIQIRPGLWEICDGENIMWTGDGGKELFDKAMMEAVEKYKPEV